MSTLADVLASRAPELADRALELMYRDPFWLERFGARGRSFAEEDGRHHVAYLVEALRAGDPTLLREYARWLQSVLTTRGMCSLHLAANFARLRDVIATGVAGNTSLACAYLGEAADALTYDGGPAREVQIALDAITTRAVERDVSLVEGPGAKRVEGDLGQHGSYLADALALGQPALFEQYAAWMAGFYERLGLGRERLQRSLDAIDESLDVIYDETLREMARAALARGIAAAREELRA